MHLVLAALHADASCSNLQQKTRMAASDFFLNVRIERAWVLDRQSILDLCSIIAAQITIVSG
jgi:hypothetical protein